MGPDCPHFKEVLARLERDAPGAPLLALGQTVFWDEPMKAALAQALHGAGSQRRFIAGVHDTDYFAKFESPNGTGFAALPHNDTTTKNLWSAAGEISCLFGSETVVTKEKLAAAGGKLHRAERERPGFLDEVTEAWGWRGVVSMTRESRITAEKQVDKLFAVLFDVLQWAVEESLELISGPHKADSEAARNRILTLVCEAYEQTSGKSVADFYEQILPHMMEFVTGAEAPIETTRTTALLRFNRETVGLPRFDALRLFVEPRTRSRATEAYDDVVRGSQMYTLDRFGTGALPFDVFVPGHGRGTLKLGSKGGVLMTPKPVGFSVRRPIESLEDLAAILEDKFGPEVVVVGKAVTLLTMLAREFVFVFHEGASGYVPRSASLARRLAELDPGFRLNPILRVEYDPWGALDSCCAWLMLPEPLRRPFGTPELSAQSFSVRWREVATAQRQTLLDLAELRRPVELVRYLQAKVGGQWECLANEYEGMVSEIEGLSESLTDIRQRKSVLLKEIRNVREVRQQAQVELGLHWRAKIFEKSPDAEDLSHRHALQQELEGLSHKADSLKADYRALQQEQNGAVQSQALEKIRERRSAIALEAELMRLRLIRDAVIATDGLKVAGLRPSAWWFPLVCPDGTWFNTTVQRAKCRLEELS